MDIIDVQLAVLACVIAAAAACIIAVILRRTFTLAHSSVDEVCARIKNKHYSEVFEIPGIISPFMCDEFVRVAEKHAATVGGWETERHDDYPTTDFDTADIPELRFPTENIVYTTIVPAMAKAFGLDPVHLGIGEVFIAKYAAKKGKQRRLRKHADGSEFSFVVALNAGTEYDGGGTRFVESGHHTRSDKGDGVIFCGKLLHEGVSVTRGVRYILAGFMKYGTPAGCDSDSDSDSDSD